MIMPIKTNQLKIDINSSALYGQYDVFRVETSDKYFKRGAYILDAPLLCNNVCSVYFDSGKCFYVLMKKSLSNKTNLKDVLLQSEGGDKITLAAMSDESVPHRVMVSLLLYALGSYDLEFLRFNNLTGHLYCFNPKWIKHSTRGNESTIMKIPCVELSITAELRMNLSVRTFTSELLKSKIVFKKKKFEQYPKYTLVANNTLRRRLNTDSDKCFILRQTEHDKTEIPFMDIQNIEKFESSKIGILALLLNKFNDKYNGICHLGFQEINHYIAAEGTKSFVMESKKAIHNLLEKLQIRIVDYIGDAYSTRFCEDILGILKDKYNIDAAIGKRVSRNALNLCVIHNDIYYGSADDPHDKQYGDIAVQHITLEDFMGNANAAISTVIHELLIKHDIVNRSLSLFDWSATGIDGEIAFGIKATIQDEDRYFFMVIHPDGTFDFSEQQFDLFTLNEYTDCVNIFADSDDVAGIIKYTNGDINIIRETSWFTIPEIEQLYMELSVGNTYLRGKEKREELLPSITGIKLFEQNGGTYYFVGIIGEGMRANVSNAANIRKIESYKNASMGFETLLPLMNVTFVRNGQLTVVPFPFKYLREYIASIQ